MRDDDHRAAFLCDRLVDLRLEVGIFVAEIDVEARPGKLSIQLSMRRKDRQSVLPLGDFTVLPPKSDVLQASKSWGSGIREAD
ncbi:hypothetical protein [Paraburkholderia silvatlantica]|uniref:Uncharacterized protein n=1 Tax=Paraburkholderia silvatlantica TaxID=321895 RepID=A0ABR6FIH1_9BURK|nr:hypothetical protein [Paraburkholderia silvatlantica]MBB2926339.1 hypothetical protein [Paraburkholderia silvatlantica]